MPITKNLPTLYETPGTGKRLEVRPGFPDVTTNYTILATNGGTSKTWDRTPNFFAKKKSGDRIGTLPFSYTKTRRELPKGNFRRIIGSGGAWYQDYTGNIPDFEVGAPYWSIPIFSSMMPADIYSLTDSTLNPSLLSGIKDSKVNLAQCWAERKQTVNLVTDTATRLAKSFIQLKRGNLPGALNQLGAGSPSLRTVKNFYKGSKRSADQRAASTWLEIQYGWLPLISDVYGSAEFLAQINNTRKISQKISRKGSKEFNQTILTYGGFNDAIRATHTCKGTLNFKSSVTFSVTNQAAKDISASGISNPLELAWELLPYSFVVDWFLPVGNFLSAFDATAGCSFVSGTRSFKMSDVMEGKAVGRGNEVPLSVYTGSGESKGEVDLIGRQAFNSWPTNNLPQFKNPLSYTHMANALSLLTLAFRR